MKDIKALKVLVKREIYFTIEISEEAGYDKFPDSPLEFVNYVKDIEQDISLIIDEALRQKSGLPEVEQEDTIVEITEVHHATDF